MAAAAKADDRNLGGDRRLDAGNAVLDHGAVAGPCAEALRREQEQVGGGLAESDLRGAEHVRLEEWQEPGQREALADALETAVRCDATRHRQRGEQVLYSCHRRQLALEGGSRADGKSLEKCIWRRSSEPGCDRSRESEAVLAEAECDGLVDCRRKIDRDQAFGENAGEDQLAVDQDTIAIEDNEIGHVGPFTLGPQFAAYMTPDIVICHPWKGAAPCPVFALVSGSSSAKCHFSIASTPRRGPALPGLNTRHPTTTLQPSCAPV